jgi:hypothetical protein
MKRRVTQKVLLVCLAVVVGFILGEIGLRLAGITFPVFDAYDHDRAIRLKPGKAGWYHGEGGAYVEINSLGYRDVEHTKAKPEGVFRIAVLGDSFTEARQVALAQTFWKRLETKLNATSELDGRRVEAMSFGVGGYGTTQELLTLKSDVLDFLPDLVILAFCPGNDVADNFKPLTAQVNRAFRPFYVLRDGQLVLDNGFRDLSLGYLRQRFLLGAIHHSRILEVVNQARRLLHARRFQQTPGKPHELGLFDEEFLEPKNELWKEAWAVTEAIIREMNNEVRRAGARFLLVTLTTPVQVDPDVAKRLGFQRRLGVSDLFYTERRLRRLGEEVGFPVIMLAERLQQAASETGAYFHGFSNTRLGTGHWNSQGHEAVADILAKDLPRIAQDRGPRTHVTRGQPQ